jgi:hypothetical protein
MTNLWHRDLDKLQILKKIAAIVSGIHIFKHDKQISPKHLISTHREIQWLIKVKIPRQKNFQQVRIPHNLKLGNLFQHVL